MLTPSSTAHTDEKPPPGSVVRIPDVRVAPWSRNTTVVVDVASLAHWLRKDLESRIRRLGRRAGVPADLLVPLHAATRGLHRIVDVLAHHGVVTTRLLLAVPMRPFPPESTGWVAAARGAQEGGRRARTAIARSEHLIARMQGLLAHAGVTVEALPGLFGKTGEHCVDELCVLGAAHAAWSGGCDEVIVVSWDADVAVVAALADRTRIRIARTMNAADRSSFRSSAQRHRRDHWPPQLPEHLALLPESLRTLITPDDLEDAALRRYVELLQAEAVPSVRLAENAEGLILQRADDSRTMSTPLTLSPSTPMAPDWLAALDGKRFSKSSVPPDPTGWACVMCCVPPPVSNDRVRRSGSGCSGSSAPSLV